nr:hypothetical protein [Tanacetum cinerariifolium]
MHVANTSVEARCLALEAELTTLRDKSHQENQGELIKHFSKLEVDHLNLQLKHQNLKDNIGNNPPTPDKDTPDFDSVFVIGKIQASLQGIDNVIRQLKKQLSQFQAQNDLFRAENDKIKQHYKELYDSIKITRTKHIEQVTKLTAENVMLNTSVSKAKEAKVVRPLDRSIVSACRYTKHSQELLEYAIGTYPQDSQQRAKQLSHIPLIRKKQVTVAKQSDNLNRVNSCPNASGSQPKRHVKAHRISLAKGDNNLSVDDQPRKNKSHLRITNHTMADMTAPTGQAPTMAPPVHTNDHILPHIRWVQTRYLKFSAKGTKREVFGMLILGSLITADLQEASYYQEYLANVIKHRWFLVGEPARKPNPTAQKVQINILQYLIHLCMCKGIPTKMMKMFLLVENLRQQNPDNRE